MATETTTMITIKFNTNNKLSQMNHFAITVSEINKKKINRKSEKWFGTVTSTATS